MSCYRPRYSQRYAYPIDPYYRSDPYSNPFLGRGPYQGQLIDSSIDTYLVNTYAYPLSSYPADPYYDGYGPYYPTGRVAGLNRGFRQPGVSGLAAYNYAVLR